ncbi:hypothetical protein [Sulfitobacter geojensis]|uniref:Uncharacterized protein n=1 Tax=Sulfitobacter geojensis TaxID=1342299 RepID=A0AAE2W0A1_9RHOB|nr:hypothetical protein [Sulfitobacter geojensis]MBM1690784.1 hypothetical protein [Sulfitobacter geojensis]MBM1694850.1 hypothetical protein [Sulfitobacter geojensis]MBM1706996.1 hypothetical protein [Sulfitobacter geojensis]MBM1711054.1 hypothetical protein [Sulfitobacter geojensis]MBM1715120.1 hypothetical protein [Sulfitobacter geojensis]
MPKTRIPQTGQAKTASQAAHRLIRGFSRERRNDIRGALAQYLAKGLNEKLVERIRNNSSIADMKKSAEILESSSGLKNRKAKGHKPKDLWMSYEYPDKSLELELAYASGFLNSWAEETVEAIETIRLLSLVATVSAEDAASALKACACEWGASRYLSYKVAFLKSLGSTEQGVKNALADVDKILEHAAEPALQYSALENVVPEISLFSTARRYTNALRSQVGTKFRRSHNLNNLIATPTSEDDAAAFLHRSVQVSLLDAVYAVWTLINLQSKFTCVSVVLNGALNRGLLNAFHTAVSDVEGLETPHLKQLETKEKRKYIDHSLHLYRMSAAFLEYPKLCSFRNDIDCVVGVRLMSSLSTEPLSWSADSFDDLSVLRQPTCDFELELHNQVGVKLDSFYRTYLFLRLIQNPTNLALLSASDFKYIFDNTSELDALLLESELETMHLNASSETRTLVSVLALALHRRRSSDPDVDYEYRIKLEKFIIEEFDGVVANFIKSLTEMSPSVANYLATSLNETTLQKMYRLIQSPLQASLARRDILLAIGNALNNIDYIIEAEAIETRNKVAKLKKYFDTSRMYVDSIAMRDWLEANPSAYTQEYKDLLPKLAARLTAIANVPNKNTGKVTKIPVIEISSTIDHLVQKITVDSFREFCVNTEFGIESYLGRRIRHNTLHGVMTDPIDGVLAAPGHDPIITETDFGDAIIEWQAYYRSYIERIRREFLQFRDPSKPNALFDPKLNFAEPSTRRSVSELSEALTQSSPNMLSDLVISFCWQQIGPQLDYASRQIKVKMAGDVKQSLESYLGRFRGREEQRVRSALDEAIDGAFSKVSSWFRLPNTGFVPATIVDLCNIIDIEFAREEIPTTIRGSELETQYYGISVHRLYDCLAVTMQNAIRHGEFLSPIEVGITTENIPNTNLQRVCIAVLSRVDTGDIENAIERINIALEAKETGQDMVTEGYSGLKKLKYITKLIEGQHTVEVTNVGNELELRFSLTAEVVNDEEDR